MNYILSIIHMYTYIANYLLTHIPSIIYTHIQYQFHTYTYMHSVNHIYTYIQTIRQEMQIAKSCICENCIHTNCKLYIRLKQHITYPCMSYTNFKLHSDVQTTNQWKYILIIYVIFFEKANVFVFKLFVVFLIFLQCF